jgi:hypothetical protein
VVGVIGEVFHRRNEVIQKTDVHDTLGRGAFFFFDFDDIGTHRANDFGEGIDIGLWDVCGFQRIDEVTDQDGEVCVGDTKTFV